MCVVCNYSGLPYLQLVTMRGGASSLRGFLVEFRNFSNSSTFDGNLSHVGDFIIRSGYEDSTRLECEGVSIWPIWTCIVCVYYNDTTTSLRLDSGKGVQSDR